MYYRGAHARALIHARAHTHTHTQVFDHFPTTSETTIRKQLKDCAQVVCMSVYVCAYACMYVCMRAMRAWRHGESIRKQPTDCAQVDTTPLVNLVLCLNVCVSTRVHTSSTQAHTSSVRKSSTQARVHELCLNVCVSSRVHHAPAGG